MSDTCDESVQSDEDAQSDESVRNQMKTRNQIVQMIARSQEERR
jgi:hypothetical protein